jgi:hypothetical protein
MNTSIIRFVYALLIALFVATGAVGPAYAQSSLPASSLTDSVAETVDVRVLMQDGWSARGKHAIADDFVIVCPTKEVLDPSHPCSKNSSGQISSFNDFVLVCPVKEVLDPSHPCAERNAQIVKARPSDFVLVCPVKEVLDPSHPCANQNASIAQFKIPGDYVMTCPAKEVLDPGHPCAGRGN